jgi:hypothetical protein
MSEELIRNCKLKFKCHQEWTGMIETADLAIRHCEVCDEDVHLCATTAGLKQALINNWCVAIFETETEGEHPTLIGEVDSGYFTSP